MCRHQQRGAARESDGPPGRRWRCDRGQKAPLDGTCAAQHPALRARVLTGSQAVEKVLIWASCAHVMHGVCRAAAGCSLAATLLVATQDQVPGGGPGDKPKFSLHAISACGTVPLTSKGVLCEPAGSCHPHATGAGRHSSLGLCPSPL